MVPAVRGGERHGGPWLTLIAMTGALSMILLDTTVVGVALPTMQDDLDLSQTGVQWVVNAYLLSLASFMAVGGRLADMFDRTKVFSLGVIIFVLASASAGLAQGETMIILSRAAQGLGGALMIPPSATLVMNAFPVARRGRAMGVYAGVSLIFLSLGPLVGGLATEVSWRIVFWINLPLGIATLIMTAVARPDGRVAAGQRMDWPGAATLVSGLVALVLGLMQSSAWGWSSPRVLALLAAAGILLSAFVLIELRAEQPLIELRLFRRGNFVGDNVVLFFVEFGLMALVVFGAIYVQDLLGFSPIEAGLSLLPLTIPVLLIAPVAGLLYDRVGARPLATIGCLVAGVGLLWCGAFLDDFDFARLVPGYAAIGIGIGLLMSPTNTDALNAAPAALRGAASGVVQAVRQVGSTVGLAIIGTVVASIQNNRLDSFLGGLGESSEQTHAIATSLAQSSGEQEEVAQAVPAAELPQVLEAARDAVTDGISAAYYIAGGITLLAGLVAALTLRRITYHEDAAAAPHHPPLPHDPTHAARVGGRAESASA